MNTHDHSTIERTLTSLTDEQTEGVISMLQHRIAGKTVYAQLSPRRRAQVDEGFAQAERGETIPADEVEALVTEAISNCI